MTCPLTDWSKLVAHKREYWTHIFSIASLSFAKFQAEKLKSINQIWLLGGFLKCQCWSIIFQCLFSRLEVYPKPWRTAFMEAEGQMMDKLHAFNPVTQKTLSLWQDHYRQVYDNFYFVKTLIQADFVFWNRMQPLCISLKLCHVHTWRAHLFRIVCLQESPSDQRGGLSQQKRSHGALCVPEVGLCACWSCQRNPT